MKIEISEQKKPYNILPQQGELWIIKNSDEGLVVVSRVDVDLFCYICLKDGNRWHSPGSLEEIYKEVIKHGRTMTKFVGSVTLSND